jgi:hypothetical protein
LSIIWADDADVLIVDVLLVAQFVDIGSDFVRFFKVGPRWFFFKFFTVDVVEDYGDVLKGILPKAERIFLKQGYKKLDFCIFFK